MTVVYKKKDKEFKNPIELSKAVRYKSLFNKAEKFENELYNYFMVNNLMFQFEDKETKREIYKAIDCLTRFKDNLKLKETFKIK